MARAFLFACHYGFVAPRRPAMTKRVAALAAEPVSRLVCAPRAGVDTTPGRPYFARLAFNARDRVIRVFMAIDAEMIADRSRLRRKLSFWRVVAILVLVLAIIGGSLLAAG